MYSCAYFMATKIMDEPFRSFFRHLLKDTGFFKQMAGALDDHYFFIARQLNHCLLIDIYNYWIITANN